jgi:hypothetical protein
MTENSTHKISDGARLRALVAAHLREAIIGTSDHSVEVRPEAYNSFFMKKLKLEFSEPSERNGAVDGYGIGSARGVMDKVLKGDPAFPKAMAEGKKAEFERRLLGYLKENNVISESDAGKNFLRKNSDFSSRDRFADEGLLRVASGAPDFLVGRFIELAARQVDRQGLLDSSATQGLFFFGVTATGSTFLSDTKKSFTFSDLFGFSNDEFYQKYETNRTNNYNVRRINPDGKPTLSEEEIAEVLYRRYGRGENIAEKSKIVGSATALAEFSLSITIRIVDLFIDIIQNHMNVALDLFTEKLASGSLVRTVFDIEYGALYVNQADEGRYWTVGITPIQDRVHRADDLITKDIIGHFSKAARRFRQET